ncbi:MAG: TonB-dependent receptor, partial [candidate division KSB1 bacterium]|nr:TonB-dependent receptor [candidate division KSB1 bacterium]
MRQKLVCLMVIALMLPALVFAADGKLRGRVTDKETGDPLIGANVTIEGTTLGASADINGDYIILRVPPGTYAVKASYIGYAPVTISNVIVNADLTTTLDFQLPSTAIEAGSVSIVAERPLVQRNTTNTVRITTQEEVKQLPIRGTQNILALQAGVVQQDGNLYVRGGRAGEIAYFVDGASTTNRLNNTEGVSVIQEAYQELTIQPGGFTAEYGGANSGVTTTTIRTGGSRVNFGIDYRTDDFAKPGEKFLGTSSFGFKNLVANIGGPIDALNLRYFIAGQYNYLRTPVMFLRPFFFDSVKTSVNDASPGRLLP